MSSKNLFFAQFWLSSFSPENAAIRKRRNSRKISENSEKETVVAATDANTKLIDVEEAATGSVGIKVYLRYFKSVGIIMCIAGLTSNVLNQAATVYAGSKFF